MNSALPFALPFVAAFLGWAANSALLGLLFRPLKPVRVLGFSVQGLFPKYQQQLAARIGSVVAKNLFNLRDVAGQMAGPAAIEKLMPSIESHINVFLKERLKEKMPALAMFLTDGVLEMVRTSLIEEIQAMLPAVIGQYAAGLETSIDVQALVRNKIASLDPAKVEMLVCNGLRREFRAVKIAGAVTGFLIGLLQLLLNAL